MTSGRLDAIGAEHRAAFISETAVQALEAQFDNLVAAPGHRLTERPALAAWLANHSVTDLASRLLARPARPVRALLFDKTPDVNWSLGWHQDRTIAVVKKHEVDGFNHWNVKGGVTHVEPPFAMIERMITVRVHLDKVTLDNGALKIVWGSHDRGRIAEGDIEELVDGGEVELCLAERGDLWVYRTAILHASDAVRTPARRRVLQVDYSADVLPSPLEWCGIA